MNMHFLLATEKPSRACPGPPAVLPALPEGAEINKDVHGGQANQTAIVLVPLPIRLREYLIMLPPFPAKGAQLYIV